MSNNKYNIGIDASFVHGENSGTGEYAKHLIKYLSKIDKNNIYTIFPFFTYIYNRNFKSYQPRLSNNFHIFLNNIPEKIIDLVWNKFTLIRSILLRRFDIFHSTTLSKPPKYTYSKLIFTVYDLSFYTHPQFHVKENVEHCLQGIRMVVNEADAIITISENSKIDLIKYFDCPENKIEVIPLACDEIFYRKISSTHRNKILLKYGVNKPFIFHLGSLEPRKNTLGLIKAYCLLPRTLRDKYCLVIGGGSGWMNKKIFEYIKKYSLETFIKTIGYINDADLPAFYQSAKCFVYPSFYEGFGIPPLEAMASGCPTLVSNTSCFHEVCGEGAKYCQPNDIENMSKNIKLLLLDNVNTELIKKGRVRAHVYSWEKTAKQTLNLYNNISTTKHLHVK